MSAPLHVHTFTPPLVLRTINRVADLTERFGVGALRLSPERVIKQMSAERASERLSPHLTDALEVLCRSYEDDANLHFFGRVRILSLLADSLDMRLLLDDEFERRPDLADTPLNAPIFVTGLFRSGTTFLHRLLSELEGNTALKTWQLLNPLPKPGARVSPRRDAKIKLGLFRWASSPELDAMHHVRADLPEECVFGMRLDLRSLMLWRSAPAVSYHAWLCQQDMTETYRVYRRLLQYFQAQTPTARLVLKAPMHLLDPVALLAVFPEATVIQTHRDPLQCVPSDHKLTFGVHGGVTRGVEPSGVVRANTEAMRLMAENSVAIRQAPGGDRFFDVDYRDLVSDAVGCVERIGVEAGLDVSESDLRSLAEFTGKNRQHKHGKNAYSLADYGQSADELRPLFSQYIEKFL